MAQGGLNGSSDGAVVATCAVCPRACRLHDGQLGACRARRAEGGDVVSASYGKATSLALDPIEKKPIARWRPGTRVLSVGSFGCNLSCPFCQNHHIAQVGENAVDTYALMPRELVDRAVQLAHRKCIGLAFTYNEPLVGREYVRDAAQLAHEAGLVNVLVSNGMANADVVAQLAPLIDAANIDLKGPDQQAYDRLGAPASAFDAVCGTIETLVQSGCHVEVTTLVVPGLSDDPSAIASIARCLADINPDITYHLTRFFPRWHMADAAPTPLDVLYAAREAAMLHLPNVLLGNV